MYDTHHVPYELKKNGTNSPELIFVVGTISSNNVFKVNYTCLYFFFFASRRRHTRFKCDWSSDVCSSDLALRPVPVTAARSGDGDGSERGPVPDNWNARARLMRSPVHPAADGWRRSALP